jgi:hypothetical protein
VGRSTKLVAAVGSLVLIVAALAHRLLLDGLDGFMWSLAFRPTTEFARGYSWPGFRRVRAGETKEEVVKLIGVPLERKADPATREERWFYSRSPIDSHYSIRVVIFSAEGRVTKVLHEYYID